jgi:hypothetical protein
MDSSQASYSIFKDFPNLALNVLDLVSQICDVVLPDGKVLNGQVAQGLYEMTLRKEYARLNKLTGSLTLTSGVQAAAGDKSIVDSLEGTVVLEYDSMSCPQTIVRLYRGMIKAYVNQTNMY